MSAVSRTDLAASFSTLTRSFHSNEKYSSFTTASKARWSVRMSETRVEGEAYRQMVCMMTGFCHACEGSAEVPAILMLKVACGGGFCTCIHVKGKEEATRAKGRVILAQRTDLSPPFQK